ADLLLASRRPGGKGTRWREAGTVWGEAEKLLTRLVKDRPAQPLYRAELGRVYHNLGFLYGTVAKFKVSEAANAKAQTIRAALVKDFPGSASHKVELATSHAGRAIAL